jgi:hypothetical protein
MGGLVLGGFAMLVIWLFVMGAVLMWLWNITMPKVFSLREITFWEAFRLLIIAGILFGKGFNFNMNF